MALTEHEILLKFKGLRKTGTNQWQARCPAHEDNTPSLSITFNHEKVLMCCHAGCSPEQIVSSIGLKMSDLFFDNGVKVTEKKTEFHYEDETGKHLYTVHRTDSANGKKIWQSPVNGYNLSDVIKKYPYHLPEVLSAMKDGTLILIAEGEKCVDAIRDKLDAVATTNSGGAGKWTDDHSQWLQGANVAILPDNDDPGKKHAETIVKSLKNVASSIKVVSLPGLAPKEDIFDWISKGGTGEQLEQIIGATPVYKENISPIDFFKNLNWSCKRFSDDPPKMPAIIEDFLLASIVVMIYSAGGAGKSTLFLYLCVKIVLANIHNVDFFGHKINGGNCAILTAEDPDLIINHRFVGVIHAVAAEYGLEYDVVRKCVDDHLFIGSTIGSSVRLFRYNDKTGDIDKTEYFDGLVQWLSEIGNLKIVGIDTKARFSPGEGHGNDVATQEIQHYEYISCKTGATTALLHHSNKASRSGYVSGIQAFRDASALYDSVRGCWYLRALNEDELSKEGIPANEAKNYLLFENTKNNYLPIVDTILLKRNGFGFESKEFTPKLSREEKKELKINQSIENLLSILQTAANNKDTCEPWSIRKIIELCKNKLTKKCVLETVDIAIQMEYLSIEKAEKKGIADKYTLSEDGKNYETVPAF